MVLERHPQAQAGSGRFEQESAMAQWWAAAAATAAPWAEREAEMADPAALVSGWAVE